MIENKESKIKIITMKYLEIQKTSENIPISQTDFCS